MAVVVFLWLANKQLHKRGFFEATQKVGFKAWMRHLGMLLLIMIVCLVIISILILFTSLPSVIMMAANWESQMGVINGDPQGMPDYVMWLSIGAFLIAGFLRAYVWLTVLCPLYLAKVSIALQEKEREEFNQKSITKNNEGKRLLFIDRDGTLIEEPADEQIDSFEKLKFVKGVFRNLAFIREKLDFEFVMVSNQDGLGTDAFPEDTFWPVHNFILQTLEGEGITFDDILIDPHFPEDNAPTRKPNTGLVEKYMNDTETYDIANSYVIGDRETDRSFARNIGCKSLILSDEGMSWNKITELLFAGERIAEVSRKTKETDIHIKVNLDGTGKCDISTGLGFFDHMLEQIGKHGMMDLTIHTKGDLEVDEHHTIEDTAIALGECILKALGDKRGIERYGYCLPMDDCLCSVALDFGGRPWLVWDAEFKREKIGEMPTEMFLHFFKSLSDASKMNLNIKAEGQNEHHKIEGIFKALARSLKMAVRRDIYHYELPSTKGML